MVFEKSVSDNFAYGLDEGCHLAFKEAKSAKFGLLWNCLPEIRLRLRRDFGWPLSTFRPEGIPIKEMLSGKELNES